MDSSQTLHDFVLNLLSDPQARTAFELDPEGTLHAAGLNDLTALDVQDVIPLVIDYAPVQGLADLDTDRLGLAGLEAGPAGAIQQLQLVTHQLPALGVPSLADSNLTASNLAAAGALTTGGLTSWAGVSASGGQLSVSLGGEVAGADDTYSASHDVSLTLDTAGVTDTLDSTTGSLTGGLPATDTSGLTGDLTGTAHGVTGGLTGEVHSLTGGLTDSLGVDLNHPAGLPADTAAVTAPVEDTLSHVTGAVNGLGVGDVLGDAHGLLGDTTDHLPTGDAGGDAHLLF